MMNIPQEFEDIFHGVDLTEGEIRTLRWLVGWERWTVENLRSAIRKAQATALSTLQAENEQLRAELEQAKQLYETEKEDFGDFVCSGVPNLSPYCLNRHPDCVDERGWCRTEKCHGFSRERGQKEN